VRANGGRTGLSTFRRSAARIVPVSPRFDPFHCSLSSDLMHLVKFAVRCLVGGFLIAGCRASGDGVATDPGCVLAEPPVMLPHGLRESSGAVLAEGAAEDTGIFWTHNDSGWGPVLYAVARDGSIVGETRVSGARNRDWEDVEAGPCADGGGRCLYVGDIGDNAAVHSEIVLYRIPEPAPGEARSAPAERFAAVYPGGPRDAESLFVLPDGSVYLVTKGRSEPVEVYRWPTPLEAGPVTLEPVRTLGPPPEQTGDLVTGAAASPDGAWVVIRTYSLLSFYRTDALLGNGDPELTVDLVPLGEPQGEAVTFARGDTVLLTSEGRGRSAPPRATRLRCELP
jgi:hypothetical protein